MGKRAASRIQVGLGRGLRAIRSALQSHRGSEPRYTPRYTLGARRLHETLESRLMFSTTVTPPVVNLTWQGQTVQAYQNQYVAETAHPELLESLAGKQNFTALTSLGSTFYEFDSTLPVTTLEMLAKNDSKTFVALGPNESLTEQSTAPDDQYLVNQWGLNNTAQLEPYDYNRDGVVTPYNYEQNPTPPATILFPSPPYPNENHYGLTGDDIDAEKAWDITTGSSNVVVAVLDTGIDTTHPDLIPNLWVNPLDTAANNYNGDGYPGDINGYNFVANNDDVTDDNGHGTNVAGIIGAAGDNGIGVTGVNWDVKILPVKVADAEGAASDAAVIDGINYVTNLKDHGINIVAMNESLGSDAFPIDILESDAIKQAGKAGVLDVVAAGNSSLNLDTSSFTPAKLSLTSPSVITVAAIDNQFQLAAFSNYGAEGVDLAAPGIDIYSTSPTYPVTLNAEVAQEPDIPQFTEDYGYLSGTSQATPFVTGIIALEAAANPQASPAELKAALLAGVSYDPNLASANGLPAKVLTSGVANAYNAVLNVLNYSTGTDVAREGAWQNFYGTDGAYVVGESTSFPSVANVTLDGGSPVVLDNTSTAVGAPQRVSDPTSRISAYEASASSESINIAFSDAAAHQVELYVADLDKKHRVETINLYDQTSGVELNSQTVSSFSKGEYLLYNLRGSVRLQIVNDSGPSAVYSGLFFDTAPTAPTTFVDTDTSTTGINWRSTYGSQGALVVGDTSQLPAYASLSESGESVDILHADSNATNSLQKVSSVITGIQAFWSTTTQMDLNLTTNDGLNHIVTLYLADYGNKKRSERIQLLDPATGDVLTTQEVNNFKNGEYISFNFNGDADIRITRTGGPSAVVSGVFFDAPFGENASFQGTDTTTEGNWTSAGYGLTTAYVAGDNFPGVDVPDNNIVTVVGATRKIIAVPTNNPVALLKTGSTNSSGTRVAAYLETTSSMTLDINPGDLIVHQIVLYFADYENYHRTESVTLYNGNTNTVLSHQIVSNFHKGKYLIFDVSGPVLLTINAGYLSKRRIERSLYQLRNPAVHGMKSPLSLLFPGDWPIGHILSEWATNSRRLVREVESGIEQAWTAAIARPGVHLFDGPMCRLEAWQSTADELKLKLSRSSYKPFLGTNMTHPEFAELYGHDVMANPVGLSTPLLTADHCLLLGFRNSAVAYYPGRIHPFAGSLEPDDSDVFSAVFRELKEELSLGREEITDLRCIGMAEDRSLYQRELIFAAETSLTAAEIESRVNGAEHTAVWSIAADPDQIDRTILENQQLTPVAMASLLLWGRRRFGNGWFKKAKFDHIRPG